MEELIWVGFTSKAEGPNRFGNDFVIDYKIR